MTVNISDFNKHIVHNYDQPIDQLITEQEYVNIPHLTIYNELKTKRLFIDNITHQLAMLKELVVDKSDITVLTDMNPYECRVVLYSLQFTNLKVKKFNINNVPDDIDIVLLCDGLHHYNDTDIDTFKQSLPTIFKPDGLGLLLIREYDYSDLYKNNIINIHIISNKALFRKSYEDNLKEIRNFKPMNYWMNFIEKYGNCVFYSDIEGDITHNYMYYYKVNDSMVRFQRTEADITQTIMEYAILYAELHKCNNVHYPARYFNNILKTSYDYIKNYNCSMYRLLFIYYANYNFKDKNVKSPLWYKDYISHMFHQPFYKFSFKQYISTNNTFVENTRLFFKHYLCKTISYCMQSWGSSTSDSIELIKTNENKYNIVSRFDICDTYSNIIDKSTVRYGGFKVGSFDHEADLNIQLYPGEFFKVYKNILDQESIFLFR